MFGTFKREPDPARYHHLFHFDFKMRQDHRSTSGTIASAWSIVAYNISVVVRYIAPAVSRPRPGTGPCAVSPPTSFCGGIVNVASGRVSVVRRAVARGEERRRNLRCVGSSRRHLLRFDVARYVAVSRFGTRSVSGASCQSPEQPNRRQDPT